MKKFALFAVLALVASPAIAQVTNGKVTTAAPTYTNNTFAPLSLDTSGNLRVTGGGGGGGGAVDITAIDGVPVVNTTPGTFDVTCISGCGGSGGTSSTFGAPIPTDGTAIGVEDTTGDMVPLSADANGNAYVVLKDGSNNVVPFNANGQTTAANSGPVVLASDQLGLDATVLADGSGSALNAVLFSQDVTGFKWVSGQFTSVGGGNIIRVQASDNNTDWVTQASILNVDNSGTYASTNVPALGSILTAPVSSKYMRWIISTYGSGTVTVTPVLHSSNYAVPYAALSAPNLWARGNNPGATSSGANARAYGDLIGRQVVLPLAIPESTWSYAAAGITNSTAGVTIKTAAASTIRNYIDSCQIGTSTLVTASTLVIRDGAAGTVLFRMPLETGAGMWTTTQKFEPPLRGSAATLVEIAMETLSATGTLYVNCQGHIAP